MAINWRLRSTVFQLLAAVYAELGEQGFKGRYVSIAQYFGPDASYDAIKSFFAKEVSKAADKLKEQNPGHHGSGRGAPPRCQAGPSRYPPHLYFDEEDISILTQREFEAVEARIGHSLRGPAKRARVIKASPRPSPRPSPGPEVIYAATVVDVPQSESRPHQQEPNHPGHIAPVLSRGTVESDTSHRAPEDSGLSRKRPFSEVRDSMQPGIDELNRHNRPPQFESFSYVTNHGQYRCALCLSELPSQEALDRHERISKEHLRNLNIAHKVAKGREKLTQVTMLPQVGLHPKPAVPRKPQRGSNLHQAPKTEQALVSSNTSPAAGSIHRSTPSDTNQLRSQSVGPAPSQDLPDGKNPISPEEPSIAVDKGKSKAASEGPPASPPYPPDFGPPPPRTPSQAPSVLETRPTTARTEIGTLDTPHTVKNAFTALQPVQDIKPPYDGSPSEYSATELAEIVRSTEIMIKLMGHVQREAKAVAKSYSAADSFDSGVSLGSSTASAQHRGGGGVDQSAAASAERSDTVPQPISAPGIDVYTGMRRDQGSGEGKTKRRRKDTGSEVSFIVLE
ncbi:hypothetical protein, variant [Phialophora macrospora]|uniref:DUF7066 domain-containing protein n=1 Tax=Phialophora macrospora TaxID=1851006 RepID=A0A0D2FNA7_9EURO|nr:hypothetical protein PV04_04048 [Phialophora macrospora]KIW68080.1 hypothetical protein, variant [Phialophora macrospora]